MSNHVCVCACGKTMKHRESKKELSVPKYSELDVELTRLLYSLVKQNFSFVNKQPGEKDFFEMNKLYRIDGRDYELIRFIITWCQQDSFWAPNIRSVTKLRKQFDSLMIRAQTQLSQNRVAVI